MEPQEGVVSGTDFPWGKGSVSALKERRKERCIKRRQKIGVMWNARSFSVGGGKGGSKGKIF